MGQLPILMPNIRSKEAHQLGEFLKKEKLISLNFQTRFNFQTRV